MLKRLSKTHTSQLYRFMNVHTSLCKKYAYRLWKQSLHIIIYITSATIPITYISHTHIHTHTSKQAKASTLNGWWAFYYEVKQQLMTILQFSLNKLEKILLIKKRKKKVEHMLKWSTLATLTGLLHSHLSYMINHHKHFRCFMQLHNRITTQVLAFL